MEKNIFLVPSKKASKLHEFGDIWFSHKEPAECFRNYNLYITNSEEIKEDDYNVPSDFSKASDISQTSKEDLQVVNDKNNGYRKIIMTTDTDLIADGVQEIPDEFLEWFVKNPSYEEVEVKAIGLKNMMPGYVYGIVIPSKEPKVFLDDSAFSLPDFNLSKRIFDKVSSLGDEKKIPKTETLKEATDRLCYADQSMFVMGVNWQKERSFSKEEVKNIANWAFGFYRRNDLSDSELEEEFEKLLTETLNNK
jgi:hypothetical protein